MDSIRPATVATDASTKATARIDAPRSTSATAPADVVSLSSQDQPSASPELRITHFAPAAAGEFVRTRKFVTALADSIEPAAGPQGAVFCEKTTSGSFVTRATLDGDVVYRVDIGGESPRRLLEAADHSRMYLVTDRSVRALDPASGAERGRITLSEQAYGQQILPQDDGGVVLLESKTLSWLDADLKETGRREMPWDVKGFRPLPDGGAVVIGPNDFYHIGNVKIIAADGRELFTSEQVRPASISVDSEGIVRMLEYQEKHAMELIGLDPKTGDIKRHEAPVDARAVFPQENGTYVVFSAGYDNCSCCFEQRGADGSLIRTYDFEREGRPRNFLVDPDRQQAYVVTQSNEGTKLYRVDLSATPPADGPAQNAPLLQEDAGNMVVPPVFKDGRLAVFSRDKITVRDAEGGVQATYGDLASFRDAVGSPEVNENMILGESPRLDGKAPVNAWLSVAARHLHFPDNREFVDPKPMAGRATRTADGCMNFSRTETAEQALGEMHLPDPSVYEQMTARSMAPTLLVGETEREYGLPEGPGLKVARQGWTWQLPEQEPKPVKYHDIAGALAVNAGDHHYAAFAEHANGTERGLTWCDAETGQSNLFDVGSPIRALYGGGENAVYAVGLNGTVLMFEPPLQSGQGIETPVPLPRSLHEAPPEAAKVVQTEETVVIGGVVLKRRVG